MQEFDSFIQPNMSLYIPICKVSNDVSLFNGDESDYVIIIDFNIKAEKHNYYVSIINSPNVKLKETLSNDYYCLLIKKDFFENIFAMYVNDMDGMRRFDNYHVEVCNDILKYLNMFAFESSKNMMNSEVTLLAHSTLIAHWIVRSILGESLDMRAISSDYSVARAQHYIEQHYSEKITIERLAALTYVSTSSLSHKFKSEMGVSPMDYLFEVRLQKALNMMRRKNISLTDIAMACGFSSLSHFSRFFASKMNMTPSEYMKHYSS